MQDPKLVAASAIALAVTLFAIFSLRPVARRLGLVDRPGGRKRHRGAIPLIGGLCFFIGTLVGLSYVGYLDSFVVYLMVGAGLIVAAGVVDDLSDLSVRSRLAIEALAVGLVIAATGFYVDDLGQLLGEQRMRLWLLGVPVTIVAVIGLVNAFNMLDGIDGLAGSMAMVSIAAILLFAQPGGGAPGVLLLLQILFAAMIPYLCVNLGWPDGRKIFMGDAGSTLIGFVLAWSVIYLSHRSVGRLAPVDALWCVAVPVMDTLAVMYRRIRLGRSPFKPDRQHLHHLLLDAGLTPRAALVAIVAAGTALALVGYALRSAPEAVGLIAFAAVLAAYVLGLPKLLGLVRMLPRAARVSDAASAIAIGGDEETREPGRTERDEARPSSAPALAEAIGAAEGPSALKALCVLATPPDAMKIAPIARELLHDERFEPTVCVAAGPEPQAEQVLDLFDIQPDLRLDLGAPDEGELAPDALGGLERVLNEVQPDVVLVPGDTSTALAATMAAYCHHIPVVHIDSAGEAGAMEGAERKLARALATLHVTRDESASRELIAEGVPAERVLVAGDLAADGLRAALGLLRDDPALGQQLAARFPFLRDDCPLLLAMPAEEVDPVLALALADVARRRPGIDIACAPALADAVRAEARGRPLGNLHPVALDDYLAQVFLLGAARLVVVGASAPHAELAALGRPVLQVRAGVADAGGEGMRSAQSRRALTEQILALLEAEGRAFDEGVDRGPRASRQLAEALASLRPAAAHAETPTRGAGSPSVLHDLQEAC